MQTVVGAIKLHKIVAITDGTVVGKNLSCNGTIVTKTFRQTTIQVLASAMAIAINIQKSRQRLGYVMQNKDKILK